MKTFDEVHWGSFQGRTLRRRAERSLVDWSLYQNGRHPQSVPPAQLAERRDSLKAVLADEDKPWKDMTEDEQQAILAEHTLLKGIGREVANA